MLPRKNTWTNGVTPGSLDKVQMPCTVQEIPGRLAGMRTNLSFPRVRTNRVLQYTQAGQKYLKNRNFNEYRKD